jgi:glucosamine--fructose-6-phosphate aminotransferase (isomerizing)
MCGIVGYIGQRRAQPVLLNSLAKLEYRGYDSCGIALAELGKEKNNGSGIKIYKDAVRVGFLSENLPELDGNRGIGHTRWATHGHPCLINAHPHQDCTGKIVVVHNGIITNYQKLKDQLIREGHVFTSETDTEVIPHLIEKYYQPQKGGGPRPKLEAAVKTALPELEGSYAIIVMAEGEYSLVVARKDSPLIIGIGDGENLIASDVPAVLEYTSRVIYLEDGDVGTITPELVQISRNGSAVQREVQKISWEPEQAQKGGYEHFMLKEIHEQPKIIRDTLSEYLASLPMRANFTDLPLDIDNLLLIACGTSYNASLFGKYVFETLTDVVVRVELASEFNYYRSRKLSPLTVGITQSGETADTLKAMRRAKEAESRVVAITNVVGSTASKIADYTILTRAGPEISVAATKSFMAQLLALYWLALMYSGSRGSVSNELTMELRQLPDKVEQVLAKEEFIAEKAKILAGYDNVFYLGRGINYPIALEGALKLKEISYIHGEAYAAGEIKHGPLALLGKTAPVVAIVARGNSHEAMITTIKEIKARGSPVFAIAEDGDEDIEDLVDYFLPVPPVMDLFSPVVNTVVVQLLAYYVAKYRDCPIDFPRNLAKSVTVE